MLQLRGIHPYRPKPGREPDVEPHIGSDQLLDQRLHPAHDIVDVDGTRVQCLLLPEREQLTREERPAVGRPADSLDVGPAPVIGHHVEEEDLPEPADRGEQVVEVVGHAPRDASQGLGAMGMAELFFALVQRGPRPGPVGRIGSQHQPGTSAIELELMAHELHVHQRAVPSLVVGPRHLSPQRHLVDRRRERRQVVGREQVHDGHVPELLASPAVVMHRGLVDRQDRQRVDVEDPHRLGMRVEDHPGAAVGLLHVLPEAHVVDGQTRVPRQLLRQRDVRREEAAARVVRHGQGEHADRPATGVERQPKHRFRRQRVVQLEGLGVRGGVAEQGLSDFDHLRSHGRGGERQRPLAVFRERPDHELARGVAMRTGDEPEPAILRGHVDGAPVRQRGHEEPGQVAEDLIEPSPGAQDQ